jgi:hypothetical protein
MNDVDPLLAMLQHQRETPLADEGFSQRVLDALPRAHFSADRLRRWILGVGAVTGCLSTAILAPPVEGAFGREPWLAPMLAPALAIGLVAVLAACVAWAFITVDFREMKAR